jgi:hypothetical protein
MKVPTKHGRNQKRIHMSRKSKRKERKKEKRKKMRSTRKRRKSEKLKRYGILATRASLVIHNVLVLLQIVFFSKIR